MKYNLKINFDADKLNIAYRGVGEEISDFKFYRNLIFFFAAFLMMNIVFIFIFLAYLFVKGHNIGPDYDNTRIQANHTGLTAQQQTTIGVENQIKLIPKDKIKKIYIRIHSATGKIYRLKCVTDDAKEHTILEGRVYEDLVEIRNQLRTYFTLETPTDIATVVPPPIRKIEPKAMPAKPLPKRQSTKEYATLYPFYSTRLEGILIFHNQEMQIVHLIEMEWSNGYKDKQMQLAGAFNNTTLVYFEKIKSMLYAYEEEPLSLHDIGEIRLGRALPSSKITVHGEDYFLQNYKRGKSHIVNGQRDFQSEQWIYDSKDKQQRIRILKKGDMYHYYKGQKLATADFYLKNDFESLEEKGTLDLDKNPLKNKIKLKDNKSLDKP